MTIRVNMTVNSGSVSGEIEPRLLLVNFLRDHLKLTGTHVACDTSQCGACTVHLNGKAIKSCSILAVQAEGANITTIEGVVSQNGKLHPMQLAFQENHGLQCGFCTPGMIMMAIDIGNRHINPDASLVRSELDGNICRCTGYHNIVKSIIAGVKAMNESQFKV